MCPVKFEDVQIGDMVAAHHKEILPFEILLGIFHTPRGPELGLLVHVGDLDAKERTVTECFLDCGPHVPERDDDFPEAQVREV